MWRGSLQDSFVRKSRWWLYIGARVSRTRDIFTRGRQTGRKNRACGGCDMKNDSQKTSRSYQDRG
jgi:hypothetical protein